MKDRLAEWNRLLADKGTCWSRLSTRTAIPGGVRLEFAAGADVNEIARLSVAEQDCCRFLSFALTVDGRGIGLDVRAPEDAKMVVHALFGAPA